ncbi:TetR/AcrR family transcriptional regulator [Rhodalgimonas zhirmunskyi]|uniref:TetR/AcrR family transcriptional regulator n=1 Tax=Rhodalgimonas zhirmunskyi TaxID=2964767 RepID=A0AAJ1UH67_9RHOB|nr:TetR/AcrR family transcriptional regulator [Rhodoalgimonas zhirmunskyi]MDQ2095837.1 TetR/AcrR family transcriptional regulator [Rhodoalgimonas zhirmunskyi]
MRDEKRAARAEQIENAAYMVLEEKGYSGLSMLSVAKAAKASNETLYRWYGDKLGLFEALITRNTESVRATLDATQGSTAISTLQQVGPALLTMLLGPRAVALNRAAAADASGALGRALAKSGRETMGPWIARVMARAQTEGTLSGGDPGDMAEVWFGLLIGDMQIRRVTGAVDAPSPDEIAQRAETALRRLRALFPPQN